MYLIERWVGIITASEKLTQLINNDKLTEDQLVNLSSWCICRVSELRDYLTELVAEVKNETVNIEYEEAVCVLRDLLNYGDDDYIIYDGRGINDLDFDTLNEALDVD